MTAQKIQEKIDQLGLGKYSRLPMMKQIGDKVGFEPAIVFLVISGASLFGLLVTGLLIFMMNFAVFFFPAYQTFKSFEKDDTKKHERMLIFWVCFGLLHLMDHILHFLPLYSLIRNIITMYLYMNDYKGAELVYNLILKHPIQLVIKETEKLATCIQDVTREQKKRE